MSKNGKLRHIAVESTCFLHRKYKENWFDLNPLLA